ncbi:MAG: apolipoprotein N-acyltransferase [Candidatus Omnitrophota bacterium]|nr:apolipoprotein N-acyltransferase [Candidatus Omnitrophota bacterium]
MKFFFLCLFSALLLIFSFPKPELNGLAWFAFVPLFIALDKKKMKQAGIFSSLAGVVFFLGTLYWVGYVSLWGLIGLVLYLAIYFGLFGIFASFTLRSKTAVFTIPAFWVALEYIRSHLFSGFGWAGLGYSQYLNIPLIQVANLTGVYGVSFLVVMVNVVIFQMLQLAGYRRAAGTDFKPVLINFGTAALILISVFAYGKSQLLKKPESQIRVAVVQGNISQQEKWNPGLKYLILDKYRALTKLTFFAQPDIIIWPETAVPGYLVNQKLLVYVADLAKEINTPLLIGSPFWASDQKVYNSAFLISRQGRIITRYDKLHLVPFGEYIPLKPFFRFIKKIDKRAGGGQFSPGRKYTIFNLPAASLSRAAFRQAQGRPERSRGAKSRDSRQLGTKFAVLICFEDVFSGLTRRFVRQGAGFMVNITNDAWFGDSGGPYQHVQASVLRAVENKISVIRCANTGVSCFIEPTGEIVGRVADNKGKNLFITGYLTREISISKTRTFYTRFGDLFAYLCILISMGSGICFFCYLKIKSAQFKV